MDLTTQYLGLQLKSPIVPSASPLCESLDNIRLMEELGAGAVVLQSLYEEQLEGESRLLLDLLNQGSHSFAEALSYTPELQEFRVGPDQYLEKIAAARAAVDIPIIASLNGATPGGWTRFAKEMQQAGASAIELNLYRIPTNFNQPGTAVEAEYLEIVQSVKRVVQIPVAVKLSPFFSNLTYTATSLDHAGANGLVLFNRFYQPDIDLEKLEVTPSILLSTPHEMRLPLTWIGILYGRIQADLAATTGVSSGQDALKLLMAGAGVTMVCSVLLREGIKALTRLHTEMVQWMEEHEYESVMQLRGSMSQKNSPDPGAFERAQYMKALTTYKPLV